MIIRKDEQLIAEAYNKVMQASIKKEYDKSHNSPYDCGDSDSYYRRGQDPHYYVVSETGNKRIEEKDMTPEQVEAYYAGYGDNEKSRDFKDYDSR